MRVDQSYVRDDILLVGVGYFFNAGEGRFLHGRVQPSRWPGELKM